MIAGLLGLCLRIDSQKKKECYTHELGHVRAFQPYTLPVQVRAHIVPRVLQRLLWTRDTTTHQLPHGETYM